MATINAKGWPSIPVADWQDTCDILHLYTKVLGKGRLANELRLNHSILINGGPGTVDAPRAFEAFREFAEK